MACSGPTAQSVGHGATSLPDESALSDRVRRTLDLAPDINIFRMLGHCDTLIEPFLALGAAILTATRLDPVLRELAIVRTAVHGRSDYELNQHDEIAREVGVTQAQLDALRTDDLAGFSPDELAVIRFTDEVVHDGRASDAAFARLSFLSPCEIQELLIGIGYYSMVGRYLETLGVQIEPEDDRAYVRLADLPDRPFKSQST